MLTLEELSGLRKRGNSRFNYYDKLLKHISDHPDLDKAFQEAHHEAFSQVNCLACANCCKTISPILLQDDIDNIAKHLGNKASKLIQDNIHMDEDGDFVFNSSPCPFLGKDNYCSVYEARPNACREYPHTDRRKQKEIIRLTAENVKICPAVVVVLDKLDKDASINKGR
jgi:Fe-S-cluster containining protein